MAIRLSYFTQLAVGAVLFTNILPAAHAKGRKESAADAADGISNFLQSWTWATFGVGIIAELFAIALVCASFQSLARYVKSKHDGLPPTGSWNTGGAFCGFAIIGSFFLVAFYPLFLVQQLAPSLFDVASVTNSIIPSGMIILTSDLADVTIACAFLALLRRRQSLHFPETISTWKTALDIIVIGLMITFTSVKTALACMFSTYESKSKYYALIDLFHVYLAFYLLITISIVASAILLRRKLVKSRIEDQLIFNMCYRICPFLVVQAVFRLVDEIIVSIPAQEANINYDALTLVEIVVKFFAYTYALLYSVRAFYPGKALVSIRHQK